MSARIYFGHCIGCDQPIRPPYLSFTVHHAHGNGNSITEWEEVDVCADCAGQLTAADLHRLVSADEEEAAHG
jgi:hypothetical protein